MSAPDQGENVLDVDFPVWRTDDGGLVRLSERELSYVWYVLPNKLEVGTPERMGDVISCDLTLTVANEPARLHHIKILRGEDEMSREENEGF